MKEVKLQRMKIRNFKGIDEFEFSPAGETRNIYGRNATGKTTLMDAYLWCLFGKDSLGQAAFEAKPINGGESASSVDVEVEIVLAVGDNIVTFKKVLREKWVKKRGEAERQFAGHEINHHVDGVPVQKRQYDGAISQVADEGLFRLLANPRHFNEALHWEERRRILMGLCDGAGDQRVMASRPEFSQLSGILGKRSVEDHLKVIKAKRTEINRELDELPVRIDEAAKGKVVVSNPDPKSIRAAIVHLEGQRAEIEAEMVRVQSGGEVAEKTMRLRELEGQLLAMDNEARRVANAAMEGGRIAVSELRSILAKHQAQRETAGHAHSRVSAEIGMLEASVNELRAAWNARNAEQWEATVRCPTCGQSLPDEQIQEARGNWNQQKAADLSKISSQGKGLGAKISELKVELKRHCEAIGNSDAAMSEIGEQIAASEKELAQIAPAHNPEREKILTGIDLMKSALSELAQGGNDTLIGLRHKAEGLRHEIATAEQELSGIDANAKLDERIADLKKQERRLSQELAGIEKELFLCEEFIRAKVTAIEGELNERFGYAKFKLFKQNINGGIEPTCETVVGNVPYGSLNNAARINAGIDIADTLGRHHGITLPMWLDNCESINEVLLGNAQQIRLYVSDHDTLTIGG